MNRIIIYIIVLLFFSCTETKKKTPPEVILHDSTSYYFELYNNPKLKDYEKNILNMRMFNYLESIQNSKEKRENIDKVILNYYELGNYKDYYTASKKLLAYSVEQNDSLSIAKAYRYFGNYYYNNKLLDSSYIFYIKAGKIYNSIKRREEYAKMLLNQGIVKYNINDFLGAEITLKESYNIFKNSNDKQNIYGVLNQLGLVLSDLNEYSGAIEYYEKALEITNEIDYNQSLQKSVCYNNLGLVYNNSKEYKKAIENFNLALRNKNIPKEDPELYGHLLDNLGFSYLKLGSETNLPQLFYKSLKIRDSLGNIPAIIVSNNHLSEYYQLKKDSVKALFFIKNSLTIALKSKDPHNMVLALKQASIVDKKNASKYSENYIKISDSLQLEERKNIDRFARIELETDELRQANTQLSEQNRDILNYFAIAIVFGGFLFFARFQRLKARELALKQTQQQANEEIYRLIISHQNQLEEGRDLEKKRISKELHDGVLGRLFGLRLNLDGLNNFDDEETKQQRLEYLNELKVIEQDLREISHELSRENLVLINNFVAIINNLLEQQSKINKAKINTLISDKIDWEKVSNTIKINLYRILQESLQNINKHAEASKINVIFNKDPKGNLIFSVEDDGKGYNTNGKKTKGIGMNNIVDRVHQCQGKIDIKSQIGKGTKIIITFPLENETINM